MDEIKKPKIENAQHNPESGQFSGAGNKVELKHSPEQIKQVRSKLKDMGFGPNPRLGSNGNGNGNKPKLKVAAAGGKKPPVPPHDDKKGGQFANNNTADIEKLTKAGFDANSSGGGFGINNPSHIPQRRNTIHFNDSPKDGEGKYVANIGGQDFHYNDIDTAIDRTTYKSGKSPYEGSRLYDQETKSWRFPNENEEWNGREYVKKESEPGNEEYQRRKLNEMGFGPNNETPEQKAKAEKEAREWGDKYYSNPENVNKDIAEAVEHTRKLTTDKYGGSHFGSLSVEEVLEDLPERFEQNPELRAQVEKAVEEHNKPYKINEYIGGRPLVTQSGRNYGVEFEDGKLYAGSATNSGIFHDYEIDYDDSKSIDQNLQDLYEKIEEDEASMEDYDDFDEDEETTEDVKKLNEMGFGPGENNLSSLDKNTQAWLNRGDHYDFEVEEPTNDNFVWIKRKDNMTGKEESFNYDKNTGKLTNVTSGKNIPVNINYDEYSQGEPGNWKVRSYFDDKQRGLEDEGEFSGIEEVLDNVWEKLQSGNTVNVNGVKISPNDIDWESGTAAEQLRDILEKSLKKN